MGRHDKGPCWRYVSKKESRASLRCPWLLSLSIRITVSGERIPWAVGKDGSVSQDASTELDNLTEDFRVVSNIRGLPGFLSIFWAVMCGIWEDDVLGGIYLRVDFFPLGDRNAFWFDDHAKPLDKHIMKIKAIAPNLRHRDLACSCSILLIVLRVKCGEVFERLWCWSSWLWWTVFVRVCVGKQTINRRENWNCNVCSIWVQIGRLLLVWVAANDWRHLTINQSKFCIFSFSDARQQVRCGPIRNNGAENFRKQFSGSFSSRIEKTINKIRTSTSFACAQRWRQWTLVTSVTELWYYPRVVWE